MAKNVNKVVINGVTKLDLTGDTAAASDVLAGKTYHDKTGASVTGTCTFDSDTSDANALGAEILNGRTAYVAGQKVTGTMPNRGAVTGAIATKDGQYTVPQGYHDGSGKVGLDAVEKAKLIPSNIRDGVTVLGVTGTMSGSEAEKRQERTVTPTFSAQVITPTGDYTCLAQVTVEAIPVSEIENAQGGVTLTVG